MIHKRIDLFNPEQYEYKLSFGFLPNLHTYLHEDTLKRPAVLVIPGGGYGVVAEVEGEIAAKKFFDMGYQAFVLTYTTNLLHMVPLGKQPLKEAARAVRLLRANAEQFHISDQIILCGFSAGGHLSGCLCVHHNDPELGDTELAQYSCRPDAAILCYPVITSGQYTHGQSVHALLGGSPTQEELQYMSVEKNVTGQTPPCFLWQTAEDETVPVENSLLMADALRGAGVLFSYHLFPKGPHGMSTADEVWASGEYGEAYTMEQAGCIKKAMESGTFSIPEQLKQMLARKRSTILEGTQPEKTIYADVSQWTKMADVWLKTHILGN